MKVTATFEVVPKLASQLADLLRVSITPQFPCSLIGVEIHAEPIQQQPARSEDTEGSRSEQQVEGFNPVIVNAGKDGQLAGSSGNDTKSQSAGKREVPGKEHRPISNQAHKTQQKKSA